MTWEPTDEEVTRFLGPELADDLVGRHHARGLLRAAWAISPGPRMEAVVEAARQLVCDLDSPPHYRRERFSRTEWDSICTLRAALDGEPAEPSLGDHLRSNKERLAQMPEWKREANARLLNDGGEPAEPEAFPLAKAYLAEQEPGPINYASEAGPISVPGQRLSYEDPPATPEPDPRDAVVTAARAFLDLWDSRVVWDGGPGQLRELASALRDALREVKP